MVGPLVVGQVLLESLRPALFETRSQQRCQKEALHGTVPPVILEVWSCRLKESQQRKRTSHYVAAVVRNRPRLAS